MGASVVTGSTRGPYKGAIVPSITVSAVPPSQSWRAFLGNHIKQLVSIDFFLVPTIDLVKVNHRLWR
jgi:hypothetical protein